MAEITARTETFFRKNEMGRFVSQLQQKGEWLLGDLVDYGKDEARYLAPVGDRSRPSRPGHTPFKESIVEVDFSGGQERGWGTTSKHFWWYVRGTSPHKIIGKMVFFWSNAGTWYVWNKPGFRFDPRRGSTINHPGTKPHDNWLLASFRATAEIAPSYMKRRFS